MMQFDCFIENLKMYYWQGLASFEQGNIYTTVRSRVRCLSPCKTVVELWLQVISGWVSEWVSERERERERDRQTDRQTVRQTDRQTGSCLSREHRRPPCPSQLRTLVSRVRRGTVSSNSGSPPPSFTIYCAIRTADYEAGKDIVSSENRPVRCRALSDRGGASWGMGLVGDASRRSVILTAVHWATSLSELNGLSLRLTEKTTTPPWSVSSNAEAILKAIVLKVTLVHQ